MEKSFRANGLGFLTAALLCAFLSLFTVLPGCGETTGGGLDLGPLSTVVNEALEDAAAGRGESFLSRVDPSYVEEARRETPGVEEEELGDILGLGFLNRLGIRGVVEACYQEESEGERGEVHVWGTFVGPDGREVEVEKSDALRVPLLEEGGRWYVDLLDV